MSHVSDVLSKSKNRIGNLRTSIETSVVVYETMISHFGKSDKINTEISDLNRGIAFLDELENAYKKDVEGV